MFLQDIGLKEPGVNKLIHAAYDLLVPFTRGLAADIASSDQRAMRRILQTYAEGSRVSVGEAWLVEHEAAKEWQGQGLDPAEIERRRQGITDRGRAQQGPN